MQSYSYLSFSRRNGHKTAIQYVISLSGDEDSHPVTEGHFSSSESKSSKGRKHFRFLCRPNPTQKMSI